MPRPPAKTHRKPKAIEAAKLAKELGICFSRAEQIVYEPDELKALRVVKIQSEIEKLKLENEAFHRKYVKKTIAIKNAELAEKEVMKIVNALARSIPSKVKGKRAAEMSRPIKDLVHAACVKLNAATKGGSPKD